MVCVATLKDSVQAVRAGSAVQSLTWVRLVEQNVELLWVRMITARREGACSDRITDAGNGLLAGMCSRTLRALQGCLVAPRIRHVYRLRVRMKWSRGRKVWGEVGCVLPFVT